MKEEFQRGTDPRYAAALALDNAFLFDMPLDLALERSVKSISPKDRQLATIIANGTAERLNTLDWLIKKTANRSKIDPRIMNILRLSAYQLKYLDRIPSYGIVNSAVSLARKKGGPKAGGFVNAVLRKMGDEKLDFRPLKKNTTEYLSIKYSLPLFLVKRWTKRLGIPDFIRLARKLLAKRAFYITVNTQRIRVHELIELLADEGYQAYRGPLEGTLYLDEYRGIISTDAFQRGLFYVQDASSAMVGHIINPQPGQKILDYCSAPGGKSLHLSWLSGANAEIVAHDLSPRLPLIRENIKRLGKNGITIASNPGKYGPYDIILVDAPCSGSGTIARNPDIRWRVEKRLEKNFQYNLDLLKNVVGYLKNDGIIYYTTCSLEPEENEKVADAFCKEMQFVIVPVNSPFPNGAFSHGIRLWPHRHNMDGFTLIPMRKQV